MCRWWGDDGAMTLCYKGKKQCKEMKIVCIYKKTIKSKLGKEYRNSWINPHKSNLISEVLISKLENW